MDQQTSDTFKIFQASMEEKHTNLVEGFNQVLNSLAETFSGALQDVASRIVMMDEALAHIVTRLDQIEQVMGLENVTVVEVTAEEDSNG